MIHENLPSAVDTIVLHHAPSWWFAEFRGPLAKEVAGIFGVETVPTGFAGHLPAAAVCSAIAALNPAAEVRIAADANGSTPALAAAHVPAIDIPPLSPQHETQAESMPPSPKMSSSRALLALATEIVGKCAATTSDGSDDSRDQENATLQRAFKIKHGLGTMVACSYLKERGWTFEAAHQALLQAAPRKSVLA